MGLTVLEKIFNHRNLLKIIPTDYKDTLKFENALLNKAVLQGISSNLREFWVSPNNLKLRINHSTQLFLCGRGQVFLYATQAKKHNLPGKTWGLEP